jgi:hypothetical protein
MAITLNGTTGITTPALDSQGVAVVNRTGDGTIIDLQAGGTTVGSIGTFGGDLIIGTNDIGLYFYDGATSVIPWKISTNAASDNYSDLGHPSYRWKDLYLGGGVYLGGTGSANHLDDYEEGTSTISLRGSSAEPALVSATLYYTKTGDLVHFQFGFENVNTTGYSGDIYFTGLPFANSGSRSIISAALYTMGSWTDNLVGVIDENQTQLQLHDIRSSATWGTVGHNAGVNRYAWVTGTYKN